MYETSPAKHEPRILRELHDFLKLVWSEKGKGRPIPSLLLREKASGLPGGLYRYKRNHITVSWSGKPDWRCRWVLLHEVAHALTVEFGRGHTLEFWKTAFELYQEYGKGFDMEVVLRYECAYRAKAAEGARLAGLEVDPEQVRMARPSPQRPRRRVLYVLPGADYNEWQPLVGRRGQTRVFRTEEAAQAELECYSRQFDFEFSLLQPSPGQFAVQCRLPRKKGKTM